MGKRAGIDILKRRGLLAGAAALVAGGLARLSGPPAAQAEHSAGDGVFHFGGGATNTPSARAYAQLSNVGETEFVVGVDAFVASATVHAYGMRTGIVNSGGGRGTGIMGFAAAVSGNQAAGVYGFADTASLNVHPNRSAAVGVHGLSVSRLGVRGDSRQSIGVFGATGDAAEAVAPPSGQIGVTGNSTGGTGVRGDSTTGVGSIGISGDAAGVYGFSGTGPGVYANSGSGPGFFATSTQTAVWGRSGAGTGVFGQATGNGVGVYGAAGAGGWAGYFEGNVYISGGLAGGDVSSSLVQARDGSRRAVYSVDSTEPVVEDFGEGKLVGGRAEVVLDADFAAVANGGAYHVFLTPKDDCNGLYVASQAPAGFEVREMKGGAAEPPFSYRVVATRKGATGKRLEKLERPKGLGVKDLEPPKLPPVPPAPGMPSTQPKPERRDAR